MRSLILLGGGGVDVVLGGLLVTCLDVRCGLMAVGDGEDGDGRFVDCDGDSDVPMMNIPRVQKSIGFVAIVNAMYGNQIIRC